MSSRTSPSRPQTSKSIGEQLQDLGEQVSILQRRMNESSRWQQEIRRNFDHYMGQ